MVNRIFTLLISVLLVVSVDHGWAETSTNLSDTPFDTIAEGYVPIFIKIPRIGDTDSLEYYSFYEAVSVPKEIVSKDDILLVNLRTKPNSELLNSTEDQVGYFSEDTRVYTKNLEVKVTKNIIKEANRRGYELNGKLGEDIEVNAKAAYCSSGYKTYDEKMEFDPSYLGVPVICTELDELALIETINYATYDYLSDKWASGKSLITYSSILPSEITVPSRSMGLNDLGETLQNVEPSDSVKTTLNLYNRVYKQALKMALASMMSVWEYYDNRQSKGTPHCTSRKACLTHLLKTNHKNVDESIRNDALNFYMQNILPPTGTLAQDMERNIKEFNSIIYIYNFLVRIEAKIINNASLYNEYDKLGGFTFYEELERKNILNKSEIQFIETNFLKVTDNQKRTPYDWTMSKEIKNKVVTALFETAYGKLFLTETFADYIGGNVNDLSSVEEINMLSIYQPSKGLDIINKSIEELKELVKKSINELVANNIKVKGWDFSKNSSYYSNASDKINTPYDDLRELLVDYLKKYPFAFRQSAAGDYNPIPPSAREFLITVNLISSQITHDQLTAVKDIVVYGGVALVGLVLTATGGCSPLGLTILGWASSALVVTNATMNICEARTDLSMYQQGGASGGQDAKNAYESVVYSSDRITSELLNAGLEVGALGAGLGMGVIASTVKGTKYASAIKVIINSKNFTSEEEVIAFISDGQKALLELPNANKLGKTEQLYLATKLADANSSERNILLKTVGEAKNPKKIVNNLLKGEKELVTPNDVVPEKTTVTDNNVTTKKYVFVTDAAKDPIKQKALDDFFATLKKDYGIDENTNGYAKLMDDLESTHTSGRVVRDRTGPANTNLSMTKGREATKVKNDLEVMGVPSTKAKKLVTELMDKKVLANDVAAELAEENKVLNEILDGLKNSSGNLEVTKQDIGMYIEQIFVICAKDPKNCNNFKNTKYKELDNMVKNCGFDDVIKKQLYEQIRGARLEHEGDLVRDFLDDPQSTIVDRTASANGYQKFALGQNFDKIQVVIPTATGNGAAFIDTVKRLSRCLQNIIFCKDNQILDNLITDTNITNRAVLIEDLFKTRTRIDKDQSIQDVLDLGEAYQNLKLAPTNQNRIDLTYIRETGVDFIDRVNLLSSSNDFTIGYAKGVLKNIEGNFVSIERDMRLALSKVNNSATKVASLANKEKLKQKIEDFKNYLKVIDSKGTPTEVFNYIETGRPNKDGELLTNKKLGQISLSFNYNEPIRQVTLGHSYVADVLDGNTRLLYLYDHSKGKLQLLDETSLLKYGAKPSKLSNSIFTYPTTEHSYGDLKKWFDINKDELEKVADKM